MARTRGKQNVGKLRRSRRVCSLFRFYSGCLTVAFSSYASVDTRLELCSVAADDVSSRYRFFEHWPIIHRGLSTLSLKAYRKRAAAASTSVEREHRERNPSNARQISIGIYGRLFLRRYFRQFRRLGIDSDAFLGKLRQLSAGMAENSVVVGSAARNTRSRCSRDERSGRTHLLKGKSRLYFSCRVYRKFLRALERVVALYH